MKECNHAPRIAYTERAALKEKEDGFYVCSKCAAHIVWDFSKITYIIKELT